METTKYMLACALCFMLSFAISIYIGESLYHLNFSIDWPVIRAAGFVGFCAGAMFYAGINMNKK